MRRNLPSSRRPGAGHHAVPPRRAAVRQYLPASRSSGFTLIELLVVIAIIAVLASLLLPSLSRAKFQARNTLCKNHLRQMGLGLQMYANTYDAFPPSFILVDGINYLTLEWDQLLAPFVSEKYKTPPNNINHGHDRRVSSFFLCPLFSPKIKNMPYENSPWKVPLYGYNTFGVGSGPGSPVEFSLGLSGSFPFNLSETPVMREAAVLAPSEMHAFGDPFNRSQSKENDGVFQFPDQWRPRPRAGFGTESPSMLAKSSAALKIHRSLFNRIFVDGHVETENFAKPFSATDAYLRRWNNDNQPHREIWTQQEY